MCEAKSSVSSAHTLKYDIATCHVYSKFIPTKFIFDWIFLYMYVQMKLLIKSRQACMTEGRVKWRPRLEGWAVYGPVP